LTWQGNGALLLSAHLDRDELEAAAPFMLRGDEGVIIQLG